MGKISEGLSLCSRPLQRAEPFTRFSRACPAPRKPRRGAVAHLPALPWPASRCRERQGWRHRGQPGAVSCLPVPWPAACPRTAPRAGEKQRGAAQPGAREQTPAREQQPRLSEPRLASSCASHMPANAARSLPCCREACGFLPAPGPQRSGLPLSQTIPGNLRQAQPWGKHSFAQRGGEILSQAIPTEKGGVFAGCRAGNGGERALCTWRCLRHAGLPSTPSRRLPLPPAGTPGRQHAHTHGQLRSC